MTNLEPDDYLRLGLEFYDRVRSRITVKTKTGGNQSTNISIPSLRIIYTPARPLHLSSAVQKIESPYIHMLEMKSYILLINLQPRLYG